MRSEKLWTEAVRELIGNYSKLNSYQNVILSENNMSAETFDRIIKILKQ